MRRRKTEWMRQWNTLEADQSVKAMKRNLGKIAVCCAWAGVACRVVAYQFSYSPHGAEEWVFDLDSFGFFLESLWPFLLALTNIRTVRGFMVPSAMFAYVVLFDMCKELTGANQSKTGAEIILFWSFFILTYSCIRYAKDRSDQG